MGWYLPCSQWGKKAVFCFSNQLVLLSSVLQLQGAPLPFFPGVTTLDLQTRVVVALQVWH